MMPAPCRCITGWWSLKPVPQSWSQAGGITGCERRRKNLYVPSAQRVKFHSSKDFKPTRDFNADDVVFTFDRQKNPDNPYHKVSGGSYEYFSGMDMDKIIDKVEKVDDNTCPFSAGAALKRRSRQTSGWTSPPFFPPEYADQMLKAGTPEKVDLNPIGTGPFVLQQYQKDSRILYKANDDYWNGKPKIDRLVFLHHPGRLCPLRQTAEKRSVR